MSDQLRAMAEGIVAALTPFESDLDPVKASALRLARELRDYLGDHLQECPDVIAFVEASVPLPTSTTIQGEVGNG